jgi:hypothetical protein
MRAPHRCRGGAAKAPLPVIGDARPMTGPGVQAVRRGRIGVNEETLTGYGSGVSASRRRQVPAIRRSLPS